MVSQVDSNTSFGAIGDLLRGHSSFVVLSHVRPDGDAIGSQAGLGLSLKALGKKVVLLNEDGAPESMAFLPGADLVRRPEQIPPPAAAVVIACDTASRERLGENALACLPRDAVWVNIDHHVSNERYGDYFYVDPVSPATGQIVYELLSSEGFPLTAEICENLFVAISTDTGSFQYPNTTAATFRAAADLIDRGADPGKLATAVYGNYPLRRVQLLGELLGTLKIGHGGRWASWAMTIEVARRLEIQPSDTDGLIDHIRSIEGVIIAAFFQETGDGCIRASLRSKDPRADVCRICQQFDGGGHHLAAGARLASPLREAEEKITRAIDDTLNGLD